MTPASVPRSPLRVTGGTSGGARFAARAVRPAVLLLGAMLSLLALAAPGAAAATACPSSGNAIVLENCRPGSPASEWDVSGAGDPSIQGFATDMSVDRGSTLHFKIATDSTAYRLDIYRMGWYGGDGARKVATVRPSATLPQNQPKCLSDDATGLVDCGNWAVSASWDVPADTTSGVYFAKLVREDDPSSGGSHIVFVVRDDAGHSNLLFQTSDTTWQAYNTYGGNSLYRGGPGTNPGRAYKVSYNRPVTTRQTSAEDWVFNAEYPAVRWLERNGYDVSYFTGIDSARRGDLIGNHDVFLSVGHDEYWSGEQRANVQAARDAGVNLAFLSGNESFWKSRWEPSIDGSGSGHRTLVSYKETHAGAKIDPLSDTWTGTWRDKRAFNPEGPQPENALTGTLFMVNSGTTAITVPAADGRLRLWRNTSVAGLAPDATATLSDGTLGYEWNEDVDNGARPAGLLHASSTTLDGAEVLQDNGSTYARGTATHHVTLYRDANGAGPDALVFGAGTVQWSWGLDGTHDRGGSKADPSMQQATVNLLADMGVQPATLQNDLTPASGSLDTQPAGAAITSPESGGTVQAGRPVTITGTAGDLGGGAVGAVEVSVDDGASWHPATGRESWRYSWTPPDTGTVTIRARAADDSGNLQPDPATAQVTVAAAAPAACPCTIFAPDAAPAGSTAVSDNQPIELGTRFRADEDGFITALRFYKAANNTGTHVGHLWSADGLKLAEATFTGESGSGWQEVRLSAPVAVTKGTTYVASYHSSDGLYSADNGFFATSGVDSPPLHAPTDGVSGANGVFRYGASAFPTETFGATNYWVDVVFDRTAGPDTTAPRVTRTTPADTVTDVDARTKVTAVFDEPLDPATVTATTFTLRSAAGDAVAADVSYDEETRTATLTPGAALERSTSYTATVRGGDGGVTDAAGNALAGDRQWSFTTAAAPPPPPDDGPGGPILVATDGSDQFGRYYGEILRNEGLNAFKVTDLSNVTADTLAGYQVLLLAQTSLTDAQVSMVHDWVQGGGNLIAMRPDAKLADLLGLGTRTGALANEYLKVDTASGPGAGITADSMQFHGTADVYEPGSATTVAALWSSASAATSNPAVTLRDVGPSGGQAAAFTYDLARSVVYTRQGNPAWAGQSRDGQDGPIRSDNLFFGARAGDVQPDWVDMSKVAIPQADEHQRLLANLITEMNLDRTPLPRFWYLPRGDKAAVVMTGDDHANGGTAGQFARLAADSKPGCSVADWECVRATSYLYPSTPLNDAELAAFQADGFEVGLHTSTGCADFTPASLDADYSSQLAAFASVWPSISAPTTNRTHCIAWSDWAGQPKAELAHGIRLDANYYYWPETWVQNRPGMFTGSGFPMRFADTDGSLIDVYQAATQITDESGVDIPKHIAALLDGAVGSKGYYGVFTMNMHTDNPTHPGADAIVAAAQARGVPIVSARQMLTWLDGRNQSSFRDISATDGTLRFTVAPGAGARGLEAMVPVSSAGGPLARLTRDGQTVATTTRTVKGVEYAFFAADAGAYAATYEQDSTAPAISSVTATPHDDGTVTVTWRTDEPATSHVRFGTAADALDGDATDGALVTDHSVELTGLAADTRVHFRVSSTDASGNAATSPAESDAPATFTTPSASLVDTTVADFGAGGVTGARVDATGTGTDGEVVLEPTVGADFGGDAADLPSAWSANAWPGGDATADPARAKLSGGALVVDGARVGTDATYDPGRSLEFVATLGMAPFEHVGFGATYVKSLWAMFSTKDGTSGALYARTSGDGGTSEDTLVPGVSATEPHRYRIDWTPTGADYYVDGVKVASHAATFTTPLRPLASDLDANGPAVSVDWLRMGPYTATGTLTSRVLDAGHARAAWQHLDATADTPAGTGVSFETRSGDTPTPDDSWSPWAPVSADGSIASPYARSIQYRASLTGGGALRTPALQRVAIGIGHANGAPKAGTVSIAPAAPRTDAVLTATAAGFTDPEDDALTYRYRWLKGGVEIPGETGRTLDLGTAGNGDHGDTITVEVTAVDAGGATSDVARDAVTVADTAPAGGRVTVSPADPARGDTLTAKVDGFTDADGDDLAYRYTWTRNGTAIAGADGATLPLDDVVRGDEIAVAVTADDGHGGTSDPVTDTVTAGNSAPTLAGVTVTPADPTTGQELTAAPHGFADPDRDAPAYRYRWFVGADPIAGETGATLDLAKAGNGDRGDRIRVEVTADDGHGATTAPVSDAVTVADSAPEKGSVVIAPEDPTADSTTLTATVSGFADADADALTYTYRWLRNGSVIDGATGPTLTLDHPADGDVFRVDVVAGDGHGRSSDPAVAEVTVGNAAPHAGTVSIAPLDPATDAVLTAKPGGFSDLDGDALTYHYAWSVGDTPIAGATGDTLDLAKAGHGDHGDRVTVRVTADDGHGATSAAVTAAVTVANSVPFGGTIAIAPAAPRTADRLTANASGFTDPDGDSLALSYAWSLNGAPIAGATGATLTPSGARAGDVVAVTVTADDGHGGIATVTGAVTLRAPATQPEPPPSSGGLPGMPTTPAAPAPAAPAPQSGVAGGVAPTIRVRAVTPQHALRTRRVSMTVRCETTCTVSAQGRVALGPARGRASLTTLRTATVRRSLPAKRTTTLRLTLSRSTVASLGRALARRRVATVRVTVVATGRGGGATKRTVAVRVVR